MSRLLSFRVKLVVPALLPMRVLRFDNCEDQRLRVESELVLKVVASVMVALLFNFFWQPQQCDPSLRFRGRAERKLQPAFSGCLAVSDHCSEASASAVSQRAEGGLHDPLTAANR